MMNVEKTTLETQTCSVSVSQHIVGCSVTHQQLVFIHARHVCSSACDCNMEGTERPSCDPETGECICRIGVTGIFCDECAPGYDSNFPACRECHPCNTLWAENVTDFHRAAQILKTLLPLGGDDLKPQDSRHLQQILKMQSQLEDLSNLTGLSPPEVEKVEELYVMTRLVLHFYRVSLSACM